MRIGGVPLRRSRVFRVVDVMMVVMKQVMFFGVGMGVFAMRVFSGFMRMRHRRCDGKDAGDNY